MTTVDFQLIYFSLQLYPYMTSRESVKKSLKNETKLSIDILWMGISSL